MRFNFKAALLASTMLLAAIPAANALDVVISNDNNGVGVKGQTFDLLAEEIRKRLPDADVEVHHSGALFDQKTQIQGLQLGSAHIISPTSGIYAPVAPGVAALTLPFLLDSPEKIVKAMEDETVRSAFVPDLEAKNIVPIAIWVNGPRELAYRGSKPILTPADMAGVKIRVQSVPSDIAAMKAVGANVVAMSWSEVPTALGQGVIDAVEPAPNALSGAGLIELIDQVTNFHYQYAFYIVGANKMWWDGLSDAERTAIQEALDVATAWNLENAAKENAAAYEELAATGKTVHDLTPEQRAAWSDAMTPVWAEFGDSLVGEAVMTRLKEIAAE
ncbi:TRAP transporter substrate-binding protein [Acuticoccus kandeliae]|uniref:TRAP transporter substrate-binding protein n=1 Tax=Acuticoccus kandeliae TaxID=2073160 RepID=UPI00130062F3|nr:TRAP transporter substrate-binding protein [Acuticoccus kandeliae]